MLETPAKINLFLKVSGRRADSCHDIETLFMPVACPADQVEIDFSSWAGITIAHSAPGVPDDKSNICWKAADAYARKYGIPSNWKICLKKQIPVAAGMGGGSSDAAGVLRLLDEHYQRAGGGELAEIALSCGADVPFFLNPRPALGSGRGEILRYPELEFGEIPLLLLNPGFPVPAAWAYRNLASERIGKLPAGYERNFLEALRKRDLKTLSAMIINDLAAALYRKFPALSILKEELLDSGAAAAEITGSGPTLFGLYENASTCRDAAVTLNRKYPQMTVIETCLK
ncbi:MAG: 4-(cytidine 5'-diphospho)-2-C-methyl-D-erythritol kinase [Victivallales bacterium]|nr:4-(cytidine 5'-diphospho)-2-C-methyl-D-erythritol kinase [Victivallales bacterium]